MSHLISLTKDEYVAELERHVRALNEHVQAMSREDGSINIEVLSDSFAIVLSHYVGQIPPERISAVIESFDALFDDGLDEFVIPPGAVIQ